MQAYQHYPSLVNMPSDADVQAARASLKPVGWNARFGKMNLQNLDFYHHGFAHAHYPVHHGHYWGHDLMYLPSAEAVQAAKANLRPMVPNGPSFDRNALSNKLQATRAGLSKARMMNLDEDYLY